MTRLDRLIVQRVEVDALLRAAQRPDHFVNQVRGGVRNADAEPDAGAHRRLALFDHGGDGLEVFGFDFAGGDQEGDEFINRFPAVRGPQIRNDLLFA